MQKLRRIIVYLLIAVIALAIVVMVMNDQSAAQQKNSAAKELEAAQRPYLSALTEVKSELALMDREYKEMTTNTSTVHFLFPEPDARILTEAVPLMEPFGYAGMVAVSERYFPGDDGCLTVEQLNSLAEQGWGICLSAEAGNDLRALYDRSQANGLAAPQAVYFADGDCTLEMEQQIAELGISAIIQYGGTGPKDAANGGLWYLEARGTYDEENYNAFMGAITGNTGMVLVEGWQRERELFSQDDFQTNLTFFEDYVKSGQTKVTSVGAAYQQRVEAEAARVAYEQEWTKRRTELLEKQKNLEETLRQLGMQDHAE